MGILEVLHRQIISRHPRNLEFQCKTIRQRSTCSTQQEDGAYEVVDRLFHVVVVVDRIKPFPCFNDHCQLRRRTKLSKTSLHQRLNLHLPRFKFASCRKMAHNARGAEEDSTAEASSADEVDGVEDVDSDHKTRQLSRHNFSHGSILS